MEVPNCYPKRCPQCKGEVSCGYNMLNVLRGSIGELGVRASQGAYVSRLRLTLEERCDTDPENLDLHKMKLRQLEDLKKRHGQR